MISTPRTRIVRLLSGSILLGLFLVGPVLAEEKPAETSPEGVQFFENKIRPLLVENCYGCHSAG
ncbi:MAG: hypothetical protein JO112_03825, partial [Planctomycetes bacterium]|nr:hypothetical protein [Planctomycetota bacterium]